MTKTVTATAVRKIITKGLTGWQAGKLILQDMIDFYHGRDSVLTESDMTAIRQAPMEGADVRDYNMFMALCRGFHAGYMIAQWACKDACLQIGFLDRALEDADIRRTVELFESFGPHVVTKMQYEAIVAAQREKKLAFEFGLGYVIEERFYARAPEARAAVDEAGVDTESAEQFAAAVPAPFADYYRQAVEEVRSLHASGKLLVTYCDKDAGETEPLLKRWKEEGLPIEEALKLVDKLCVIGQALYDCPELPEWTSFMDEYQQHWFEDDERFRHTYAVMEDCPQVWIDKRGHYKAPTRPSEWITHSRELLVGLTTYDNKARKSIERAGAELRDGLDTAEQNIRMFLAIKTVLDTAADAVKLDVPGGGSVLANPDTRLDAFISLYNIRLEELKGERKHEMRLEKALMTLPAVDVDKLKPTPDSVEQLKSQVLNDARGEEWLRIKVQSLECMDGISFKELLN